MDAEFKVGESAKAKAKAFIENEKQFQLGFLLTEQSNPITARLLAILFIAAFALRGVTDNVTPVCAGWLFQRGDVVGAESASFDAKNWEPVSIPHDWAIAGPFHRTNDLQNARVLQDGQVDPLAISGRTGALPWVGVGWYRGTFEIPSGAGFAELKFDGAMAGAQVWIDGKKAGERPYGYIPFFVPAPTNAGRHTVAVRLENLPMSTRWYAGAGLYRPVWLVTGPSLGLAMDGTFVRTVSLGNDGTARVVVSEKVRGASREIPKNDLTLTWRVLDPNGREIASASGVRVSNSGEATGVLVVKSAPLWSVESPNLCRLRSELKLRGAVVDSRETRFGIRTVELRPEGFCINGKPVVFNGVCLHHDLGSIGAAFNASAFRRQLRILREMGANAIRTAHNPPAPDAMSICDEEGFLVMSEAFDMWKTPKVKRGSSLFFGEWWKRDLTALVELYRNHPSIVMWSIGNEIWETDARDTAMYGRLMADMCRSLDPSRPVTQGLDRPSEGVANGYCQVLDIPGVNYNTYAYGLAASASRCGLFVGSETASTISSRGVYKFPVVRAKGGKQPDGKYIDGPMHPDGQCSSYDVECCYWANLPDVDFAAQASNPGAIGQFVWTGFDYLGEPTPYKVFWPSRSSYFGIVDLSGIPKDRYWLYRSQWRKDVPTLHVLPHWTWPEREGQVTPVYVYTSYPSAELFVNGKSQGHREKRMDSELDRCRLRWNDVRYEPGELKVVACGADGRPVAEKIVRTAGAFAKLVVEPEPVLHPDFDRAYCYPRLRYFRIRAVDEHGNLCPDCDLAISVRVNGGKFRGICNGDATSLETFVKPCMRLFHGELVVTAELDATGDECSVSAVVGRR